MKILYIIFFILICFFTPLTNAQTNDSILDYIPSILSGAKSGSSNSPGISQPVDFRISNDYKGLKLPRIVNFKVELPKEPESVREYVIDINQWDIPTNRSNPVKTTNNLQAAIEWAHENNYNRIVLPNGHYLIGKYGNPIYQRGIELKESVEFVLSDNAILEMDTNDKWNYCVIAVTNEVDIVIRGGTIIGDRDTHIFTPREQDGKTAHDEGHGICLQNGTNRVLVEDMEIKNLTGDGLLLVTNVSDITIRNNEIHNNRRQGVSIVGGVRINIYNNEIHHIKGTSPQFGIDIEGAGRIDKDIMIFNNNFHHNRGGDIVNTSGKNVFILKNTLFQGKESEYIDGPLVTWHKTYQVIAHNDITMLSRSVNTFNGYIQYSGGGSPGHDKITYVHDNICNNCGMYMYKTTNVDIRRNQFLGHFLALAEVTNAKVIDNVVTSSLYCWAYRFRKVRGYANNNTYNGLPFDLPLSNRPWTVPCLR